MFNTVHLARVSGLYWGLGGGLGSLAILLFQYIQRLKSFGTKHILFRPDTIRYL